MELTSAESLAMREVSYDMDLMILAREFTGMESTSIPDKEVLEKLHETYSGGVTQFYLLNKF